MLGKHYPDQLRYLRLRVCEGENSLQITSMAATNVELQTERANLIGAVLTGVAFGSSMELLNTTAK
jgi:hypothetical protein